MANSVENIMAKVNPAVFTPEKAIAEPQNMSLWDKTKDFFSTPTGRSLGAGLLTSGLVGLTGGNGLEALSYGAKAGGTASNVYRDQFNKEQKRQQEDNYFKSKLAESQIDREARQEELKQKTAHDWELAEYNHRSNLDKMYKQNELEVSKESLKGNDNAEKQYQLATSNLSNLENLVKNNPNLTGMYAPMKVGVSRLTGGEFGLNSQEMQKRGEIVRNLGSIRNDLIAQAKANGQSGINTAREIEMATAGLNENSSAEEIQGALKYMNDAAKKVRDLSATSSVSGFGSEIVRVQSPDGRVLNIPQNKVQEAVQMGGRVL